MDSDRKDFDTAFEPSRSGVFSAALCVTVLILPSPSSAQQRATTTDGREVLLKEDGTWEYVGEQKSKNGEKTKNEPASTNSSASPETSNSDTHFRDTRWGMSLEEVMNTEVSEPVSKDKRSLVYDVAPVAGLPMVVGYIFAQNKLVRARYVSTKKHPKNQLYVTDFQSLKKLLTQKYGAPESDQKKWRIKTYRDDRSNWGRAVAAGHVRFLTTWETPETNITLSLSAENRDVKLIVEYASKKLQELERETREDPSESL